MPLITYPGIAYSDDSATPGAVSAVDVGRSILTQTTYSNQYVNPEPRNTLHVSERNFVTPTRYPETGFPIGGPAYRLSSAIVKKSIFVVPGNGTIASLFRPVKERIIESGVTIEPWMHQTSGGGTDIGHYNVETLRDYDKYQATKLNNLKFAFEPTDHITSKVGLTNIDARSFDNSLGESYPVQYSPGTRSPMGTINLYPYNANNRPLYQFRGAMTEVNPEGDGNPEKQMIVKQGLENYDKWITNRDGQVSAQDQASQLTPTSPLHPFMRSHPDRARTAIMSAYNRTRLPVADVEHRKAFRYIFITRPECYLMSGYDELCMQALYDEEINATWSRMPHIIRALSPVYVIQSSSIPQYANWNYLLCNRVMSLNASGHQLSVVDSMTKAVRGATVTPGKIMTSNLGGTLELTFRDTKYMDVYEMLRNWMLYIHKRKIGKFFPPFNGYQFSNNFAKEGTKFSGGASFNRLHPYDRAIEYGASIFDVITNETGSQILYWCKYYGLFPTSVSSSILNSTQNAASIKDEATVSAQFQYQYKQENVFKNLVEFNFNAGIVDSVGNPRGDVLPYLDNELSFLYRENGTGGSQYTAQALKNYIGAASMFTGSPFIVSETSAACDPWSGNGGNVLRSRLCFVPIVYGNPKIEEHMNLGITDQKRATNASAVVF